MKYERVQTYKSMYDYVRSCTSCRLDWTEFEPVHSRFEPARTYFDTVEPGLDKLGIPI